MRHGLSTLSCGNSSGSLNDPGIVAVSTTMTVTLRAATSRG
jgi:hypothetical protein